MSEIIKSGYAEQVLVEEIFANTKQVLYIPHHGVYHKKKGGKIRVVFDCSAIYDIQSLNQQLHRDSLSISPREICLYV